MHLHPVVSRYSRNQSECFHFVSAVQALHFIQLLAVGPEQHNHNIYALLLDNNADVLTFSEGQTVLFGLTCSNLPLNWLAYFQWNSIVRGLSPDLRVSACLVYLR